MKKKSLPFLALRHARYPEGFCTNWSRFTALSAFISPCCGSRAVVHFFEMAQMRAWEGRSLPWDDPAQSGGQCWGQQWPWWATLGSSILSRHGVLPVMLTPFRLLITITLKTLFFLWISMKRKVLLKNRLYVLYHNLNFNNWVSKHFTNWFLKKIEIGLTGSQWLIATHWHSSSVTFLITEVGPCPPPPPPQVLEARDALSDRGIGFILIQKGLE